MVGEPPTVGVASEWVAPWGSEQVGDRNGGNPPDKQIEKYLKTVI
jgi:hypothetical protein